MLRNPHSSAVSANRGAIPHAHSCAGLKGEPQIPAHQPDQLKAWESWQSEDCGASSSASSNASSLSLPMQETWEDILAQMPAADAAPMLWQPQFDARADQSMATSTALLPGPIASCIETPFADVDADGLAYMLLPPLPGALQHVVGSMPVLVAAESMLALAACCRHP